MALKYIFMLVASLLLSACYAITSDVKHIQKRQAELEARVSELTGSVEELRTLQEENNEKIDAKIDALEKRLEQIDASYRRG
ncbi:MAG: hypothetical protein QXX77_05220, partial [Candidatus Methanosuratincola sp.]